ncbi:MAG: histidinol dehydrogenase [Pseudomonadales bacterium]|nr:histidinol dehydrogenase [Pseudomonadales bacterium]
MATNKPAVSRLNYQAKDFIPQLDAALSWESIASPEVEKTVHQIIQDVRANGDQAVLAYTNRFDRRTLKSAAEFKIGADQLEAAANRIDPIQLEALQQAAQRITDFHQYQTQDSWDFTDAGGSRLGQLIRPLNRVAVYVPGGKAAYPSTVLMNLIPAKVAGVREIVMLSPSPDGQLNDVVMAAAHIAGVEQMYSIGGAQAVAAAAYGTETIPAVDKLVGPGNIYVAAAKRIVFGRIGIDMIAGPSEILIICDGKTDPDWIAMDLFSQAEHDENAQSILMTPDSGFIEQVQRSIDRLLPTMERYEVIAASLENRGIFIEVPDMDAAIEISNHIAPEHLELSVEDPHSMIDNITNAGAIFCGRHTSEALGDYCAGPNHVLPTSGTARFSSPLGVYDFQKRTSLIECSPESAAQLGEIASILARAEGFEGHARAAEMRIPTKQTPPIGNDKKG